MPSPFLKAAQSAIRAATAVGATKTATLRRSSSTYDPATGANTTTTTDYSWTGVLAKFEDGMIDGSTVVYGDRRWLGAASDLPVAPDPATDKLIVDGATYAIRQVITDPADATHELQVRR